jgi:hypothetical protein
LSLHAEVAAPEHAPTLTLYRDGTAVATSMGSRLEYQADGAPGAYRVEATLPVRRGGGPLAPWIVSNPIYVGPAVPVVVPATPKKPARVRCIATARRRWSSNTAIARRACGRGESGRRHAAVAALRAWRQAVGRTLRRILDRGT